MSQINTEDDIYKFLQPVNQWPKYSGYRPLSETNSEIRLLKIAFEPGTRQICVEITHASLYDRDLTYAALSYCWGPPDRLEPISINGEEVCIRGSLHAFLTALCENERTHLLWLDSLCINQQDSRERNWQVRMMGGIYTNAVRVHVWLGEATPESDYFLSFLRHRRDPRLQSSPYLPEHKIKAQNALPDVAQRPYWNRLWIIQEISLAVEVFIWCGRRRLGWTEFLDGIEDLKLPEHDRTLQAINEISTSRVAAPMHNTRFSEVTTTSSVRTADSRRGSTSLKLVDLVKQFKDHKCEDVRDRVYGLVSIAADGAKVEIDYQKTIAEVMIDLVKINFPVMDSGAGLKILPQKVKELWTYLSLEDTWTFFATDIPEDSLQFRSEFLRFLNTRQLLSSFLFPWSRRYGQTQLGDQMLDGGTIFLPARLGDWPDVDDLLFRCDLHSSKAKIVPGSVLLVLRLERNAQFRIVGCLSSLRLAPHFLSNQSLRGFRVRDQIQICSNILPPNVVEDYSYVEFERYLQIFVHHNKAFLMSAIGETCGKPRSDFTSPELYIDLMRALPPDSLRLNICNCASRSPVAEAIKSFRQEVIREQQNIQSADLKLIRRACDQRKARFAQMYPSQFVLEERSKMGALKSDFKRAFARQDRG